MIFRVGPLPESALEAATQFHTEVLPAVTRLLDPLQNEEDVVLVFPPASYDHRGWRLAAVQGLAREAAPKRVNGVVGEDEDAIADAVEWLAGAPGISGQLLAVGCG